MHARGLARVQAPDCGAPAGRSDFAAGLILLSFCLAPIHAGRARELEQALH